MIVEGINEMAKAGNCVTIWLSGEEREFLKSLPLPKNDGRVSSGYTVQIRKLVQEAMIRGQAKEVIEIARERTEAV